MKGDLISRKSLLDSMDNWYERKYKCVQDILEKGFEQTVQMIKDHPTAYDVEKVIQQLEEKISSYELCVETAIKEIDKNPQNASTFEVCSLHNNRGYLNGLKKALEIVKSGGIDSGQKGGV